LSEQVKNKDGVWRYTIKPVEEQLTFDKGGIPEHQRMQACLGAEL
jgi:hypothetical protein